jgi:hypothetical protein
MRPEWFRLEAGEAAEVWRDQRTGFLGRVAGPHFETICRDFALRSGLFGGPAAEVGSGVVKTRRPKPRSRSMSPSSGQPCQASGDGSYPLAR